MIILSAHLVLINPHATWWQNRALRMISVCLAQIYLRVIRIKNEVEILSNKIYCIVNAYITMYDFTIRFIVMLHGDRNP